MVARLKCPDPDKKCRPDNNRLSEVYLEKFVPELERRDNLTYFSKFNFKYQLIPLNN